MLNHMRNDVVTTGLDPAIHDLTGGEGVDARDKRGHDGLGSVAV